MNKKIAIILGSETDRPTMEAGNKYYEHFGLDYEIFIISAHRNPKEVHDFASSARKNGWNKPIPNGFSEFTVGRGKKKVFILNEIKDL